MLIIFMARKAPATSYREKAVVKASYLTETGHRVVISLAPRHGVGDYIVVAKQGDNYPTDIKTLRSVKQAKQVGFAIGVGETVAGKKGKVTVPGYGSLPIGAAIMAFAKFAKNKDDVLLHMQMDWNDRFGWPLNYFMHLYRIPPSKIINPSPVGVPRSEIARMYSIWDINLNATGGEGFGLPVIEGFMCGTPSIAVDYTTFSELIAEGKPGPRGLLCDYTLFWDKLDIAAVQRSLVDIDDYVKAMNTYYYNRDLLEKHGKNAREWALKNVTLKKAQHKWIKLVKDTLNKE